MVGLTEMSFERRRRLLRIVRLSDGQVELERSSSSVAITLRNDARTPRGAPSPEWTPDVDRATAPRAGGDEI